MASARPKTSLKTDRKHGEAFTSLRPVPVSSEQLMTQPDEMVMHSVVQPQSKLQMELARTDEVILD